ncbi:MAG: PrsW family intramembrane metalloprotease [Clostridia bacterium]|nr:PrsW family intramembrane metalloprotease [Clostridia bacterium]
MNDILLIGAALLPAILLCVYVYRKDRVEKEPLGLLAGLFFLGVIICFPAAKLEEWLLGLFESLFLGRTLLLHAAKNFIGIALVEEGLKYFVLRMATRKNEDFNSLFDGMIYAVFVSLGFAAFENILYVTQYGFENAILRALTAVPTHMFLGVIMGYYYSLWHVYDLARLRELKLQKQGRVAKKVLFSGVNYKQLTIIVPVLAHGFYDFCCTMDSILANLVFVVFLCFLYVRCFGLVRWLSARDARDIPYTSHMLRKKYPELAGQEKK